MKKYLLFFSTVLLLAACNSGSESSDRSDGGEQSSDTTEQTSSKVRSTTTASTKTSASSVSETSLSSTKNSQTNATKDSNKTDSSHSDHAMSALDELKANYPNDAFPDPATISGNQQMGITAKEEAGVLTVNYYAVNQTTPFNDPALNNQTPVAQFQRQTFESSSAAQAAVGQTYDPNGQAVDLGHQITGYQTGGAGSSFLSWQEGNWSLAVQASNLEQEDPVPLAKQTVDYLETAFLPVPKDVGQISLRVAPGDYQTNRVVWQAGQTVYTVTHGDAISSLKLAVSMAK